MAPGSDLGIVRAKIAAARSVTVLTGAGISADSGVPTFRGADGLWRNFRAEDLATPEAFEPPLGALDGLVQTLSFAGN